MNTNILFEVQQAVCDMLNADSSLSSINFLAENAKDIEFLIKKSLSKQGICGMVMTPKAKYLGKTDFNAITWELPELQVQIVENVLINRGKLNCITGQDASMKVFDVLGKQHFGEFCPVDYEQGEDQSLLVNKCTFKCVIHPTRPTENLNETEQAASDNAIVGASL